jgi:hypothetical protein
VQVNDRRERTLGEPHGPRRRAESRQRRRDDVITRPQAVDLEFSLFVGDDARDASAVERDLDGGAGNDAASRVDDLAANRQRRSACGADEHDDEQADHERPH